LPATEASYRGFFKGVPLVWVAVAWAAVHRRLSGAEIPDTSPGPSASRQGAIFLTG
jgi:hypothetical protein